MIGEHAPWIKESPEYQPDDYGQGKMVQFHGVKTAKGSGCSTLGSSKAVFAACDDGNPVRRLKKSDFKRIRKYEIRRMYTRSIQKYVAAAALLFWWVIPVWLISTTDGHAAPQAKRAHATPVGSAARHAMHKSHKQGTRRHH
jgi:hypothetical protein